MIISFPTDFVISIRKFSLNCKKFASLEVCHRFYNLDIDKKFNWIIIFEYICQRLHTDIEFLLKSKS